MRTPRTGTAALIYDVARKNFERRIAENKNLDEDARRFALSTDIFPSRRTLYDLQSFSNEAFLTDVERDLTYRINGPYGVVLRNKVLSYQVLSHYALTPKVYVQFTKGKRDFESDEYLAARESGRHSLFLKPTVSAGGEGGESIEIIDGVVAGCDVTIEDYLSVRVGEWPDLIVMSTSCVNDESGRV